MTEKRIIPDFPNYYATKGGRIWSQHRKGVYLTGSVKRDGYLYVGLYIGRKLYTRRVSRLVLETYAGPCPEGMVVTHKNGDQTNNRLSNLKWSTRGEIQDARVKRGEHEALGKYDEDHMASRLFNHERRMIHGRYLIGGCTQRSLAAQFDVSQNTIHRIVHQSRWRVVV